MASRTKSRPAVLLGDGTASIQLTRGLCAIIDARDVAEIQQRVWSARPDRSNPGVFYAVSGFNVCGKLICLRMHNVIMRPEPGFVVDHINRNPLDNRRCNLRIATIQQNACNRKRPVGATGFIGVQRVKSGRFVARLKTAKRHIWSATFDSAKAAAAERDRRAIAEFGEFATINAIDEGLPDV